MQDIIREMKIPVIDVGALIDGSDPDGSPAPSGTPAARRASSMCEPRHRGRACHARLRDVAEILRPSACRETTRRVLRTVGQPRLDQTWQRGARSAKPRTSRRRSISVSSSRRTIPRSSPASRFAAVNVWPEVADFRTVMLAYFDACWRSWPHLASCVCHRSRTCRRIISTRSSIGRWRRCACCTIRRRRPVSKGSSAPATIPIMAT